MAVTPIAAKPSIAITMGDAAGIGPEIIMQALALEEARSLCRPVVIGDAGRLRLAGRIVGTALEVVAADLAAMDGDPGIVPCIDLGLIPPDLPFGQLSAQAGECAFRAIERAVQLAQAGKVDAICTAPISKAALHAAGHRYPGHTEILAALTGAPEVSLMMVTEGLRVIHVTMHVGLLDAVDRIEPELVFRTIMRGHEAMRQCGIAAPRLAVCGINPHAGEGGLFGRGEEEQKITPAIDRARAHGIDVVGALPADTLFWRARRGEFDLVVAMYHDQGLAPVKVLGLDDAVNVTVGLPVIRTSVGHGTAFDIAGRGMADSRGLLAALRQAAYFARRTT